MPSDVAAASTRALDGRAANPDAFAADGIAAADLQALADDFGEALETGGERLQQSRESRESRSSTVMAEIGAATNPVTPPRDAASREILHGLAKSLHVLQQTSRVSRKGFYKATKLTKATKSARQSAVRQYEAAVKPRYLGAFHRNVDELRARGRKLPLPATPDLAVPSDAARAERKSRAVALADAWRAQPAPTVVAEGDTVSTLYDEIVLYEGIVVTVTGEPCQLLIRFDNGDLDTLSLSEVRLVAVGNARPPPREVEPLGLGGAAEGVFAGTPAVQAAVSSALALGYAEFDGEVESISELPAAKIGAALGALDGPSAASNFDAAVAGRRGVVACRRTPNPLLAPYDYDGVVWDLGCGSGIVSESLVDYAGSAGLKVGRVTNDIDPRRKALLVGDVRAVNYVELARRAMPFFVMLQNTCTSLSNAAHVYRAPGASLALRARKDMTVSVTNYYVQLIEFLFSVNEHVLICFEFPKGRMDNEPCFAKLQAAGGGRLRTIPYTHCARYGCAFAKPGYLVTNLKFEHEADMCCKGDCASMKLMKAWTGHNCHADHCYFDHAVAAARYPALLAADIAVAALKGAFSKGASHA